MTGRESSPFTIRSAEPGDYEAVRRILSGPRAIWGTMQLPFPSAELWRRRLAEPQDGTFNLLACTDDDDVVGQLGLYTFPAHPRRRHVGRLGMTVRDDWQGKGVGTALMDAAVDLADKWLNLRRLELDVYVDNEPAIRLYERFGFVVEGRCTAYAYRDGEFVDALMMARVREGTS